MNFKLYIKSLFILVLLFANTVVLSQERVLLKGEILNEGVDRANIHVVNLQLQTGTITTGEGFFEIEVREGDTLHFSAVQFDVLEKIITSEIFSRKRLLLYLNPAVNELDEVVVNDLNLSGRLDQDLKIVKTTPIFDPVQMGISKTHGSTLTVEERRLYVASSGIGLGSLINFLSGRTKMLKKHVAISQMEARVQNARSIFNDSIYINELNIPRKYIDDFVHYVFQDKPVALKIAEQQSQLDLLDYLIKQASNYREHKQITN